MYRMNIGALIAPRVTMAEFILSSSCLGVGVEHHLGQVGTSQSFLEVKLNQCADVSNGRSSLNFI